MALKGHFTILTSGSTGSNKRVLFSVETMMALGEVQAKLFRLTPDDRVALTRTNGIPLYHVLFSTFSAGATVIGMPELHSMNSGGIETAKDFAAWINREKITVLWLLGSTYRYLMSGADRFPHVRLVNVGGEMILREDLEVLFKQHFEDDAVFVNRYATSETSWVSLFFATKKTKLEWDRCPVGRPIPGVEISIRNKSGDVRDKGEILVRTPYASLGYVDDPELMAKKFVDGWYHTGDLGWVDGDGILHHEGRII